MWHAHLRGEQTSLNPLSMMEALIGAMRHSAHLTISAKGGADKADANDTKFLQFCDTLQTAIHAQMVTPGKGTRDLSGPTGLSTVDFVNSVKQRIESGNIVAVSAKPAAAPAAAAGLFVDPFETDTVKMREMFDSLDTDKSGQISFDEFVVGMKKLGVAPRKL